MRNPSSPLGSILAAVAGLTMATKSGGFPVGTPVIRDKSPNMPANVVGYSTMLPEQRFNPDRAAARRRIKAMGGRRQYQRTVKALRRLKAQLAAIGSAA